MRKGVFASLILLVAFSSSLCWGQFPDPNGPPTREEVLHFMQLLNVRDQIRQAMAGTLEQAKRSARQVLASKTEHPTSAQFAELDRTVEEAFKSISVDDVLSVVVPVYQKHLTRGDLETVLAFYSSPVGQKLLHEMPAMTTETIEASNTVLEQRFNAIMDKIDQRTDELVGRKPSGQ